MDCPYCGTSNRDEDKFCRKCGKAFKINKGSPKISKFRVGWMVWWRAMLPVEVAGGLLVWNMWSNFITTNLAMLPFLFFLLNWAGKVVARKKYGFNPLYAGSKNLAIGFTVVPIPAIGWGILWRVIVYSLPLRLCWFAIYAVTHTAENIFLLLVGLLFQPAYILLMIIILGWATTSTISTIKMSEEEMGLQEAAEYLVLCNIIYSEY